MENSSRWAIEVSRDTGISLRGMKKGGLSKFIERAVQKEILAQTAGDIKQRNSDLSDEALQALIDEDGETRT